jgi:hypothetical protein
MAWRKHVLMGFISAANIEEKPPEIFFPSSRKTS